MAEVQGRIEMMEQRFLRVGHGKYNVSGHGIDAIYRHVDTGEIAILESKWRATWRVTWNPQRLMGRGYGKVQMSDEWIFAVRDQMLESQCAYARRMGDVLLSEKWQHKFVNVMNRAGESSVYPW